MINWIRTIVINWLKRKKPLPQSPLSDFERIRHELKTCDVLLVEGRTKVSEVIKLVTQSSWSHAALYIGRLHDIEDPLLREHVGKFYPGTADKQLIIESELGMGTVVRGLTAYEREHIRICRPRGLSYKDSQKVIAYAIGRLGTTYDVRQIFDLARFLFPWAFLPRRWRSTLFSVRPGKSTQTVCSTMIAESFGSIQFPILPLVKRVDADRVQLFLRNPKLCIPKHFDYSPYFDIIKYPFLDFQLHADQRLLPWQGHARLSAEEKGMYMTDSQELAPLNDDIQ
tara:strand:+ start:170 stop:1018 length:849 start_codon:yes stop_codon:yes gene_type:complete